MGEAYLQAAHDATRFNRDELSKDDKCACFCCMKVFSPSEIKEWSAEENGGKGVTAICPYCDVDSVLSESSGFPLTKEFLGAMHTRYFGDDYDKKPAVVRYIGQPSEKFTTGKDYQAFFVEYVEGERNSLHVMGNDGEMSPDNSLEDFEIISDDDNVLNNYEAIVKCVTHDYEGVSDGITFGKEYKAIARDSYGFYLVMDNSFCCYFYAPDAFEIVADEHGILNKVSVYYSYLEDRV